MPWVAHRTLHARHRNEKIKVQYHAWITNSKKKQHFPSRLIQHVFSRFANVSRREILSQTAQRAPFCPKFYSKGSKSCVKKTNSRNTLFSLSESFLVLTVAYFFCSMHWVSSKPKFDCHFPDPERTSFDPELSATPSQKRERPPHKKRASNGTPPRNQNGDFSPQSFMVHLSSPSLFCG